MEHHTVIYGRAMHDAVSRFFQYKISGKDMELAYLLEAFRKAFDPQGFLDAKHQQERLRVGEEALIQFFNDEKKRQSRPLYIEKEFSFILEANKINGRFDRVDMEDDGAVIMDFKTSQIKTQEMADKRVKESLQLALYALAYENIFAEMPKRVALYFLESGIVGSREVEAGDLEKAKEKIKIVAAGIRQHNYEATPAYMSCAYCAYNQICPHAVIK